PTASAMLGSTPATRTGDFYLIVQDLTASVSPSSLAVVTGGQANYTLSASGLNDLVQFGCGALPAGVTCTANPATSYGGGPSTITVSTTGGVTPPGPNNINFVVSGAGVLRTGSATLSVQDFSISS